MVELESVTTDGARLRQVYGCYPSGVTAVCALDGDEPAGIAASSFTTVSLDPALVSVCVQNTSATWPRLRALPRLGVSVLSQEQNHAGRTLSLKNGDRFAGVPWVASGGGAVFVHEAVAWLECAIHQELPAGDHTLVLLEIHALRAEPDRAPLVFHGSRFRQLAVA